MCFEQFIHSEFRSNRFTALTTCLVSYFTSIGADVNESLRDSRGLVDISSNKL